MFNRYIVVPLVVWAIAQFMKFVIAAIRGQVDFKYLYGSGGMPSVHSAVVTSLAVTAFAVDGVSSASFGLAIILAAIVMYDSFGVRRSAGEQAVVINQILDSLDGQRLDNLPHRRLREILGHKPLEVSVGAVVGLLLGILFNYDKFGKLFDVLSSPVHLPITYALGALSLLLIIVGVVGRWFFASRYRKVEVVVRAAKTASAWAWVFGIVGLILAFFQYEKVDSALWAVWTVLFAVVVVAVKVMIYLQYRVAIPEALVQTREQGDKRRWFEGPNKKRRAKAARSRRKK